MTFVDSDDFVEYEMYKKMYKENCDIIISGYYTINENNETHTQILTLKYNNKMDYCNTENGIFNSPWNKLYNREMIKKKQDKIYWKFSYGRRYGV